MAEAGSVSRRGKHTFRRGDYRDGLFRGMARLLKRGEALAPLLRSLGFEKVTAVFEQPAAT